MPPSITLVVVPDPSAGVLDGIDGTLLVTCTLDLLAKPKANDREQYEERSQAIATERKPRVSSCDAIDHELVPKFLDHGRRDLR